MVKFSKQFEGQLVPEWKEAFVDYCQLKKDIKKIHVTSDNGAPSKHHQQGSISKSILSPLRKFSLFGHQHREHGIIQVHKKLASSASKGDFYETELLEQFADSDAAMEFFSQLDHQLNKVNQFYKSKEAEFMDRGETLKKQMQILIELRTALKKQRKQIATNLESKEDPSISCTISCDEESVKGALDQQLDQENSTSDSETNDGQLSESQKSDEIEKAIKIKREGKLRSLSGRVVSCQGKNVKINIPLTTPTRTLSAITYLLREDLGNQSKKFSTEGNKLSVNKTKIHHAEKMIRGAFIELYKGLGYLKTYRHLNILAFAKILKKFDKATGKQVLPIYLKVVESSYFNSSDKEIKLADEVEELFVRNFAEEDRRKAMKYLKPRLRKESHAVTFFIVTNSQVKCGMRGHLGLACNAVGYVDRQVWGINHLCNYPVWQRLKACTLSSPELGPFQEDAPSWCRDPFEPEGLLSSISAIMSCTIGVHYGHVLIHFKEHSERLKHWISMGLGLLIVAIILHFTDAIPIKQLYSFSYVCFTAGAAGIVFSGFYILIDIFGYRTPFLFLEWIGMNAMLVFVMAAQGIFAGFVNGWYYGDQDKTLVNWIQEHVFNDVWHSERLGTLLYVIFAEITFWGVVSGILHKLGIYWKL